TTPCSLCEVRHEEGIESGYVFPDAVPGSHAAQRTGGFGTHRDYRGRGGRDRNAQPLRGRTDQAAEGFPKLRGKHRYRGKTWAAIHGQKLTNDKRRGRNARVSGSVRIHGSSICV